MPEAADGLKKVAHNRIEWLDAQMAGREYLSGKRFTLADILLYGFIDFGGQVGQPLDPANKNLAAWFARVKAAAVGEGVGRRANTIIPDAPLSKTGT